MTPEEIRTLITETVEALPKGETVAQFAVMLSADGHTATSKKIRIMPFKRDEHGAPVSNHEDLWTSMISTLDGEASQYNDAKKEQWYAITYKYHTADEVGTPFEGGKHGYQVLIGSPHRFQSYANKFLTNTQKQPLTTIIVEKVEEVSLDNSSNTKELIATNTETKEQDNNIQKLTQTGISQKIPGMDPKTLRDIITKKTIEDGQECKTFTCIVSPDGEKVILRPTLPRIAHYKTHLTSFVYYPLPPADKKSIHFLQNCDAQIFTDTIKAYDQDPACPNQKFDRWIMADNGHIPDVFVRDEEKSRVSSISGCQYLLELAVLDNLPIDDSPDAQPRQIRAQKEREYQEPQWLAFSVTCDAENRNVQVQDSSTYVSAQRFAVPTNREMLQEKIQQTITQALQPEKIVGVEAGENPEPQTAVAPNPPAPPSNPSEEVKSTNLSQLSTSTTPSPAEKQSTPLEWADLKIKLTDTTISLTEKNEWFKKFLGPQKDTSLTQDEKTENTVCFAKCHHFFAGIYNFFSPTETAKAIKQMGKMGEIREEMDEVRKNLYTQLTDEIEKIKKEQNYRPNKKQKDQEITALLEKACEMEIFNKHRNPKSKRWTKETITVGKIRKLITQYDEKQATSSCFPPPRLRP